MTRLTKTVGEYYFGAGTLSKLSELLARASDEPSGQVVYFIDHFFKTQNLPGRLPIKDGDSLIFVDTRHEPTTAQVDALADEVRLSNAVVSAVVGIGGGSTLDIAKAVSNLLANPGKAEIYQGWDLLKYPGVFKIGIPTISGTGAEASRTCVLMNEEKNLKLGMNSDFTVFDRLVLDPDLLQTVPRDQYFFTGMDTYIHCVESLSGRYRHPVADAFAHSALDLCRRVFGSGDMQNAANREALMTASLLGGNAIGNSFVGVVHPFSAGLSMVFKLHHCVANCIVMNVMDDFYPREAAEFRQMVAANGIKLPTGVCKDLSGDIARRLYEATIVHEKPLANALGDGFRDVLTFDAVTRLFQRM